MNPGKYRYLVRRLLALRPEQPVYIVAERIRHRSEKRRFRSDPEFMSIKRLYERRSTWLRPDAVADVAGSFRGALVEVLPGGWWQDGSFWELFSRHYLEEASQLIATAESIISRRIHLFQWKELEVPNPVVWSTTLEADRSGEVWPNRHYSEIKVLHDPVRPERDVKWCWELNRFQHLLSLGASWRLTQDGRFARAAREHIESWMDGMLYPEGIQWTSNLEVALRVLSWARCHVLCLDSPEWTDSFLQRFITCLHLHVHHLERELVIPHPDGNHLLGEASALAIISLLYPLFAQSGRRLARAIGILDRLVPRLFLSDGVYAEQSTGYLRFVAEFLLPVIHLAKSPAKVLSKTVAECLANGLNFIQRLSPDIHDVPMIGDADTGSAIGWRLADFWDFSPLPASGSVLLDRPELAEGISEFPAESFLLLGNQARERFNQIRAPRKTIVGDTSRKDLYNFPAGGYQISRDDRFSVAFDGGPLGLAPGYAHGHADGLAFLLHHDGKPVLVDPGTFLYNGPREWRLYFRSAAAHNTLRIDSKDPAETLDTFRWARPYHCRLEPPTTGDGWRLLKGRLNGNRCTHSRVIVHVIDQGIVILDQVTGKGEHELEWRFHFDPDWAVEEAGKQNAAGNPFFVQKRGSPHPSPKNSKYPGSRWSPDEWHTLSAFHRDGSLNGIFVVNGKTELSVLRGSMNPIGGWYSRYYGEKVPACTLSARVTQDLPAVALTAIKPAGNGLSFAVDEILPLIPKAAGELLKSDAFRLFAEQDSRTISHHVKD